MTSAKKLSDQITKAMEGVTPGPWEPCHHLKSPQHDVSCNCGYRGGIWGNDGQWIVVEMGSSPDIDGKGKVRGHTVPKADRPTQLRDAAYILATQPNNMRVILSALADAELQTTANSRIAELEQQIANIKASRDLQVTIAADEEERARKAESERGTYEEILRVVCGHLELPQSESGPADDLSLYDRALEQADVMYCQTEAERVEHKNARYSAEAKLIGENRRFSVLIESKDETIRQLNEEVKFLRPKLAEAMKVIEPFAKIGDAILGEAPIVSERFCVFTDCEGDNHWIDLEELRSLSAFLSKLEAYHAKA